MDLGIVAMESAVFASHDNNNNNNGSVFASSCSTASTSTYLRKGTFSHGLTEENQWRFIKMPRTEPQMLLRTTSQPLFNDGDEHMLSFSSSSPNDSAAFPYYQTLQSPCPTAVAPYMRTPGMVSETSYMNMHGVLARARGPFTPSQWMELEHQALIYKYIDANHPIPPNLLTPLKRSVSVPGFSTFSNGSFRSNALSWGSFHLGFSGSADPEPGRCRRTDGKKWRCSRDAVADGKYCERHMNRGRHRSRKHVEGQNGHAPKPMPAIAPSPTSTISGSGGTASTNNLSNISITQHQMNRSMMSKDKMSDNQQDSQSLYKLLNVSPKPMDTFFSITKQHHNNTLEGTSTKSCLELIPSTTMFSTSTNAYPMELGCVSSRDLNDEQTQSHPLRYFFDDWPKVDEVQSNRTQLSISIPTASSDFSSSNCSTKHEKLTLSPLKLSREFDPFRMSLGVGGVLNEGTQSQPSWNPVAWGPSMGGPLGEVLTNTNNTPKNAESTYSTSSLNLLTEGWDSSPHIGSSPTGVLQKTAFGSLSSSTGSSPRAELPKRHDTNSSTHDELLATVPLV